MKKLLVWNQKSNDDNMISGCIMINESEYLLWVELLQKQDFPFNIDLTYDSNKTFQYNDGQELLDAVRVFDMDEAKEINFSETIGNGIGVLNFYTDVVLSLDNDDFIIDMSDSSDEEEEEEEE